MMYLIWTLTRHVDKIECYQLEESRKSTTYETAPDYILARSGTRRTHKDLLSSRRNETNDETSQEKRHVNGFPA